MDPQAPIDPSVAVTIQVNGTAAALLVKLMQDMGTDEPMSVLTRALGMLESALAAKRQGRRLGVYDPSNQRFVDLII